LDTWTWDTLAEKGLAEILAGEEGRFAKQTIELIKGLRAVLGKGALLAYLISMTQRIVEIHRALKPTGAFYLHCDPTASHYLKLVCDSIFCRKKGGDFLNEIVWCYKSGGASKKYFSRKHDILFLYSKSNAWTFNFEKEKSYGQKGGGQGGKVKYYDDEKGSYSIVGIKDWWEISMLSTTHSERLGYPTQKPEALLERIIKASSNEGDVVLDAYCGCGTTIAVAERLNRQWVGIDITYQSIALILKRLEDTFGKDISANVRTDGIPKDMKSAIALTKLEDDRVRKEFEKWAILTYTNNRGIINETKGADGGVDGVVYFMTGHNENATMVIQVKSGKPTSRDIRDLRGAMEREEAAMATLITLEKITEPMRQEAKTAGQFHHEMMGRDYDRIQIVTIEEMLDGSRMELPLALEVLKAAERKGVHSTEQPELDMD